ncbi:hypothetical protein AX15_007486 [Amanita polypyramis BW_CC]|nr:hypothetical protein AX15_007486 [Amanita polypyramis BW_CC]
MATPKKTVHWGTNNSFSDTDGSSFASCSSDHSSSTLEYANAQLVAHGFAPPPGLSLEGISNANAEHIAKCLLDLLGHRTNDMARTEDLSTKLRVLQYDHERLQSMHRAAQGNAENAERETNLYRSRLAAANKSFQAAESLHKQTTVELQRTRSSLQSIRTAHQTELKKKEREFERMVERWSKVADVQSKLSTVPAGITCANAEVVEGTEHLGISNGFLEVALEQAEQSRAQLSTENLRLKMLALRTVNQLYGLIYKVHDPGSDEEPPELTMDNVFPLNPPDAAEQRVTMAINDFEDMILSLSSSDQHIKLETLLNPRQEAEIVRLQNTISSLHREIERLQEDSSAQLREAQNQFDQYVQKHERQLVDAEYSNAQEKEKTEQITRDLEKERKALADDARKFYEKKAAFEAEKSSWETQKITIEKAPPPQVTTVPPVAVMPPSQENIATQRRPSKQRVTRKAQGKSPMKTFKVGKSNRRKAVTTAQIRKSLSSPSSNKVIPSYETEVIPLPVPSITLTGTKNGEVDNLNMSPTKAALLTTSFVLPPPSPAASLPRHPMNLGQPIPPPQFLAPPNFTLPIESPSSMDEDEEVLNRRKFPVAKPLARQMIHAYSPMKPSPLSHVFIAPQSPDDSTIHDSDISPTGHRKNTLMPLMEEDDPMLGPGHELFPQAAEKEMSLAQQLGIPDSPPELSGLKRKRVDSGGSTDGVHQRRKQATRTAQMFAKTTNKGRVLVRDPDVTSMVKGKSKVDGSHDVPAGKTSTHRRNAPTSSASSSKAVQNIASSRTEKENERDESGKRRAGSTNAAVKTSASSKPVNRKNNDAQSSATDRSGNAIKKSTSRAPTTGATSARARLLAKLPPSSRGVSGARRILVESPEMTDKKESKKSS